MKTILFPERKSWSLLAERPLMGNEDLREIIQPMFQAIQSQGDTALYRYTERFDGVGLEQIQAPQALIDTQAAKVKPELEKAIRTAATNIRLFHEAQQEQTVEVQPTAGLRCWRQTVAIEKVGLYIPAGNAPLFSTLLMLGIPARIAGCNQIVVCTPPSGEELIPPPIAFTARLLGIDRICTVGGAQAVAALAVGTGTIPKVDKIFGPGNQYVTAAKQYAAAECGVAVDLPAGPTEVLIIADGTVPPQFVAADLLSQAEHGADSLVMLLALQPEYVAQINEALERQITNLPRRSIAEQALQHAKAIVVESIEEAIEFSNLFAPEHLVLALDESSDYNSLIRNAGSVFIGAYTPEALGDYASGTNHTLPTNGAARGYSGVSLDSFVKKISFQQADRSALQQLAATVEEMAEAEGLAGHAQAIRIRLSEDVQ